MAGDHTGPRIRASESAGRGPKSPTYDPRQNTAFCVPPFPPLKERDEDAHSGGLWKGASVPGTIPDFGTGE